MDRLGRLLRPRSIAVIGGGTWCANVIRECAKFGYEGTVHAVHPTRPEIGGVPAVTRVQDLPAPPDAAFIGVNRTATIDVVAALSRMGAGGAVCFANGYREAEAELPDGPALETELVAAAGEMPIFGPNCYGFVNALDRAVLWPDQHGMTVADRGVAIVTQSSNIALNFTMQARGLPLAYVMTVGNQAQTGLARIGAALLNDPRVTALGLYIEGIGDIRAFEALAATARRLGKPIVAIKAGASDQARAATVSHTGSLAGSDAGGKALLDRLGIGQVTTPAALLECLKILHIVGPLAAPRIASLSCSGGEASLMADRGTALGLTFPPLTTRQTAALRDVLGPGVALANPLDYQTRIWGDAPALSACFSAMTSEDTALTTIVLDLPRPDRCDPASWDIVVDTAIGACADTGRPLAILATLPEAMPEPVADRLASGGVVPLSGLTDGLEAIAAAARIGAGPRDTAPVLLPGTIPPARVMTEAGAKAILAAHGLDIPKARQATSPTDAAKAARDIGGTLVLKGEGAAHKSEEGLVALGLTGPDSIRAAADAMSADTYLVEEMIAGGIAELLVGVLRDPAHGYVLTLAQGGTLTELFADSASLLLPASAAEIDRALAGLRIAPLLDGYRGKPAISRPALHAAIAAIASAVTEHAEDWSEVEVNPLICTPNRAVAADALIRTGETP
ncbi:acetate--CoA ligase family protein [Ovoidimarina sediminis]|uniref:acetate--CoA ligase family protein n=1 Tax=Ovoidimarina sediminis TaxID=3079856 RepID=UPI00290C9857|nr:acetate--CoA ligase family protein [Rhodophyticola sp. MJ-SS7]MDU8943149.1 acetate--CoA ligase family protein [Rhodophyticola sp. MJ-SS7]